MGTLISLFQWTTQKVRWFGCIFFLLLHYVRVALVEGKVGERKEREVSWWKMWGCIFLPKFSNIGRICLFKEKENRSFRFPLPQVISRQGMINPSIFFPSFLSKLPYPNTLLVWVDCVPCSIQLLGMVSCTLLALPGVIKQVNFGWGWLVVSQKGFWIAWAYKKYYVMVLQELSRLSTSYITFFDLPSVRHFVAVELNRLSISTFTGSVCEPLYSSVCYGLLTHLI